MTKIATPHFDFESKKEYMKPTMRTVELKHRTMILAGSTDANGMNSQLQGTSNSDDEVESGWQADIETTGNTDFPTGKWPKDMHLSYAKNVVRHVDVKEGVIE